MSSALGASPSRVPAIRELRQRVRKSEDIPWISQYVIHPYVSIYLTSLFLRTGWTGNQVTLLMMACALAGSALFFVGGTSGYVGGAVVMLVSWVLDHADGEVLRYRRESSALGIYLDRFTHRVSYPLMYLGLGISLFRSEGLIAYAAVGVAVAYLHQVGVAQSLDKALIHRDRGGVDPDPLRTVRKAVAKRSPLAGAVLTAAVVVYSHLVQHTAFCLLVIIAALTDAVAPFFVSYSALLGANWLLNSVLDFTMTFRTAHSTDPAAPSGEDAGHQRMH